MPSTLHEQTTRLCADLHKEFERNNLTKLVEQLGQVAHQIQSCTSGETLTIAVVGQTNIGKSTLVNALLSRGREYTEILPAQNVAMTNSIWKIKRGDSYTLNGATFEDCDSLVAEIQHKYGITHRETPTGVPGMGLVTVTVPWATFSHSWCIMDCPGTSEKGVTGPLVEELVVNPCVLLYCMLSTSGGARLKGDCELLNLCNLKRKPIVFALTKYDTLLYESDSEEDAQRAINTFKQEIREEYNLGHSGVFPVACGVLTKKKKKTEVTYEEADGLLQALCSHLETTFAKEILSVHLGNLSMLVHQARADLIERTPPDHIIAELDAWLVKIARRSERRLKDIIQDQIPKFTKDLEVMVAKEITGAVTWYDYLEKLKCASNEDLKDYLAQHSRPLYEEIKNEFRSSVECFQSQDGSTINWDDGGDSMDVFEVSGLVAAEITVFAAATATFGAESAWLGSAAGVTAAGCIGPMAATGIGLVAGVAAFGAFMYGRDAYLRSTWTDEQMADVQKSLVKTTLENWEKNFLSSWKRALDDLCKVVLTEYEKKLSQRMDAENVAKFLKPLQRLTKLENSIKRMILESTCVTEEEKEKHLAWCRELAEKEKAGKTPLVLKVDNRPLPPPPVPLKRTVEEVVPYLVCLHQLSTENSTTNSPPCPSLTALIECVTIQLQSQQTEDSDWAVVDKTAPTCEQPGTMVPPVPPSLKEVQGQIYDTVSWLGSSISHGLSTVQTTVTTAVAATLENGDEEDSKDIEEEEGENLGPGEEPQEQQQSLEEQVLGTFSWLGSSINTLVQQRTTPATQNKEGESNIRHETPPPTTSGMFRFGW